MSPVAGCGSMQEEVEEDERDGGGGPMEARRET